MLVYLGALVLGATLGALIAHRRKGTLADILQYAFVYGAVFIVASVFLSIVLHRLTA